MKRLLKNQNRYGAMFITKFSFIGTLFILSVLILYIGFGYNDTIIIFILIFGLLLAFFNSYRIYLIKKNPDSMRRLERKILYFEKNKLIKIQDKYIFILIGFLLFIYGFLVQSLGWNVRKHLFISISLLLLFFIIQNYKILLNKLRNGRN